MDILGTLRSVREEAESLLRENHALRIENQRLLEDTRELEEKVVKLIDRNATLEGLRKPRSFASFFFSNSK